jgi:hypothetical protein
VLERLLNDVVSTVWLCAAIFAAVLVSIASAISLENSLKRSGAKAV